MSKSPYTIEQRVRAAIDYLTINGITRANYYYRLRRVRQALLYKKLANWER